MRYWLKKLVKGLIITSAVGVILLAIAVGALRLALTQLPSYQQELQSWIAGELGLSFEFEAVTARLGLGGPELTFQEASVAGAAAEESFLVARRASITLDLWSLLIKRELTASLLTLVDTRLTLLHTDQGLSIQGVPYRTTPTAALAEAIPREVRVAVRESRIVYDDAVTAESWLFTDVTVSFVRTEQRLELELTAQPPAGLAEQFELSIDGVLDDAATLPTTARIVADLQTVDLAAARRLIPALQRGQLDGRGDLSLRLDWTEGGPRSASADFAFENVAFAADEPNVFDQIDLHADWSTVAGQSQLTLSDVRLSHNGLDWPDGGRTRLTWSVAEAAESLSLSSDFLRLQDLRSLVTLLFPDTALAAYWVDLDPRGDLSAVDLSLDRSQPGWDYSVSGRFDGLALQAFEAWPAIAGLSGEVRAEPRSGRIAFQSRDSTIDWPDLLGEQVETSLLDGILVWRLGRDVLRVVSDGLRVGMLDAVVDSDLELTLPLDGSSPRLDLQSSVTSFDAMAAKRLLPAGKLPAKVSEWVEQAVQGGRIEGLQLSFFGALDAFPFDEGDGQFRLVADISDGELAYIRDWPAAVDLTGTVEFINAGFTARGSGRVLGNVSRNIRVGIPDLRAPVLGIQADTSGLLTDFLAFVQGSPLIAGHLGPGYDGVQAVGGRADVRLDLSLPLTDFAAYGLNARLQIADGALEFAGFPLLASEINGNLDIDGTRVTAQDIDAVLLDGPVKAQIVASEQPGYRADLIVAGETTADAVLGSFALPYASRLAGQTRWQGRLQIPTTSSETQQPVRIAVSSNLTGMALKFPAPFAKPPAEPMNLQLEFAFRLQEGLRVQGNLGATRRFVLDYDSQVGGYRLRRGAVRFGGGEPEFAAASGVSVTGSLPELDVSQWLGVPAEADFDQERVPVVDADLELTEFFVFGQQLGSSRFSARRGETAWDIDVDSEAIAGRISVPIRLQNRPQIVAEMQRLYLSSDRAGGLGRIDPRRLPGITLSSVEFGIGARRLGSMSAEVVPDALGLRLVSFESSNDFLEVEGSGSWLAGADGDVTRVAFNLDSSDVAGALRTLGFDGAMEGELGDVTASVYWPGPPGADWLDHVSGDVALRIETGSMLDLDPGAGRMVGLMSIVALPRRLALDFRDVFNKGLVFDEIAGDFVLVDGDAFTDNLKLTGPGAEIGIVGRTGLRDRDYEQQAVVTAEPGNILPTVGGLLGGAGVGAALLIFTRIFKQPLRGIGQASYCITGTWEEPEVERLTGDRLESDELCAALPPLAAGQAAN